MKHPKVSYTSSMKQVLFILFFYGVCGVVSGWDVWAQEGVTDAQSQKTSQKEAPASYEENLVQPPSPVVWSGSSSAEKSARARFAYRLSLGVSGYVRDAQVYHQGSSEAPCYCASSGEKAAWFSGFSYTLDVYPAAFKGTGAWYEGFGLYSQGFVTQATSSVNEGNASVKSAVLLFQGGVQYRYVWWNAKRAPDVQLKLGYTYFGFDLSEGPFPGVELKAPHVGVAVTVPMVGGLRWSLSWLASAQYLYAMTVSGGSKALGKPSLGQGVSAETGVRGHYGPFDATVSFQFQQMDVGFKGSSSLRAPVAVLTDSKLSERVMLTSLMLGYAY